MITLAAAPVAVQVTAGADPSSVPQKKRTRNGQIEEKKEETVTATPGTDPTVTTLLAGRSSEDNTPTKQRSQDCHKEKCGGKGSESAGYKELTKVLSSDDGFKKPVIARINPSPSGPELGRIAKKNKVKSLAKRLFEAAKE